MEETNNRDMIITTGENECVFIVSVIRNSLIYNSNRRLYFNVEKNIIAICHFVILLDQMVGMPAIVANALKTM